MIMQFRTEKNANGHCKYLGIDTGSETYVTECYTWICKEFPVLKVRDYRALIEQLEKNGFRRIDRI